MHPPLPRNPARSPPTHCSDEALLHAAETRTSAPLRIERDADSLQSPTVAGGTGASVPARRALRFRTRCMEWRLLQASQQPASPPRSRLVP